MQSSSSLVCDSMVLTKTKDEEKLPLIVSSTSPASPIKYLDQITSDGDTGEDGDDEDDDDNESDDIFALTIKAQSINLSKMGPEMGALTTNCQTMMHLLKGNIGTGILAMPSAFANAGLFLGTLALPIMGVICIHCMHVLVECNYTLCQTLGIKNLDYEEVAEKSFLVGPKSLRKYAHFAKTAVSMFLLITQFGFCCVYALFVSENLRQVVFGMSNGSIDLSVHIYMLLLLPFVILLNLVKSLKHLSIASAVANLLQCTGLLIVFYNLIQELPYAWERPAFVDIERFPLYMGTAIYAFEGIGLVLPLQKAMREPEAFGGSCGVLNTGMTIVACLYIAVGFFGYLKFGDAVHGSITLNLPSEPLYESCRLMFATAIFLSYAIQFYVPFNIIWPWVQNKFQLYDGEPRSRAFEIGLRAFLVSATFGLAAAIPRLDLFISLVGALSSSCLALIFPPIIEMATSWCDDRTFASWWWLFGKNSAIFLLGILGFFTGTYTSLKDIVNAFAR